MEAKTMDAAAMKRQYDEKGYIVLYDLFTEEETRQLKEEARRVLDEEEAKYRKENDDPNAVPAFRKTGVYVGMTAASALFKKANTHPRILEALAAVVSPKVDFWSDKIVFKNAETDFGSPWHQDHAYWFGSNKPSVWIALDDATIENGCLQVVEGSHKHGYVPYVEQEGLGFQRQLSADVIDPDAVVTLELKRGSAVLFHDLLFHASLPNRSGKDRWALISTYRDATQVDPHYSFATAAFRVIG